MKNVERFWLVFMLTSLEALKPFMKEQRYHTLTSQFYKIIEFPINLNTSFNKNELVLWTPSEALGCFLRTKMNALVLGDYFNMSSRNSRLVSGALVDIEYFLSIAE